MSIIYIKNRRATYHLSSIYSTITEGSQFTITLSTNGVAPGTLVPYTITGVSSSDISNAPITGAFTITGSHSNGTADIVVTATSDSISEGTETFTLTLDGLDVSISVDIQDPASNPDPYWNNTTFLLNYQSGFNDSSPLASQLLVQGSAASRTDTNGPFTAAQYYGVFDGTVNSRTEYDNSDGRYDFGTRTFTVEAWVKPSALRNQLIVGTQQSSSSLYRAGWMLDCTSAGGFRMQFASGNILSSTSTVPSNTWTHVAVVRTGTTAKMYINGTFNNQLLSVVSNMPAASVSWGAKNLRVGVRLTDNQPVAPFIGSMDEIRITDGVARYTSDFTVPSSPYSTF